MVGPIVDSELVSDFIHLFVNRRAFTIQSSRPHCGTGRHYYYRPRGRQSKKEIGLSGTLIRKHLEGKITVGLYAINPATQQCKWVAIDADYENALEDLLKMQSELQKDGIEAALEKSRRGGHLWILAEQPLLAKDCRLYIQSLAVRLNVALKGLGLPEGIDVFPKHDSLRPSEFGNAIRAPLGGPSSQHAALLLLRRGLHEGNDPRSTWYLYSNPLMPFREGRPHAKFTA